MAGRKSIIFPYRVAGGRLAPMISAGILLDRSWRPIELYVDSGAAYTILRAKVAEEADFDFQSGRRVFAQVGDGSMIPIFLHDIMVQIGDKRFRANIGFSARLGVPFNLLERLNVFDHFRICFHEKRRFVSFQSVA